MDESYLQLNIYVFAPDDRYTYVPVNNARVQLHCLVPRGSNWCKLLDVLSLSTASLGRPCLSRLPPRSHNVANLKDYQ